MRSQLPSSLPMACLALGLGLGIRCRLPLPGPEAAACLALGSLALGAALLLWLRALQRRACALLLLAGLGLGLGRGSELARRLSEPEGGIEAVALRGLVAEDLGFKDVSGRRALRLSRARVEDLSRGPQAPIKWSGEVRLSYEPDPEAPEPSPGDEILAYGRLRRPSRPMNPGEFDYRGFLLGRGITASVYAREDWAPKITKAAQAWDPWHWAWLARSWMQAGLERSLSGRGSELARGMVLGDTGGLSGRDMSVYARTGLVHILSVSGLHLALALAIFLWLGKRLGLGRRRLAWLALGLAFFYAMICGMPIPCQRSLFLFGLALLARALDLESDLPTSLAFGASLILVEQPGALYEAGCQLSFLVSLSLVTLTPRIEALLPEAWPQFLKLGLAGTAAAEFATIPLVAFHFHIYCWPSLIASIVTAPLMGPIVGLGLLCGALGSWLPWLGWPLEWMLRALDAVTLFFSGLPKAAFSLGMTPWPWFLLWAAAGLGLVFARRRRWAWGLGVAGLLFWLLWGGLPWAHRHPGLSKAWCLAVGQGDGMLVEFEDGATLLVDAGPLQPDAGAWIVGPALRALGINRIDWAVLTHPHADHFGGFFWVLDQFDVGSFLHSGQPLDEFHAPSSAEFAELLNSGRVPVVDLSSQPAPQAWLGKISLLSPLREPLLGSRHDMHNNSVVLRVGDWLTLMDDMQEEGEARLLSRGLIQPSAVLKVGHHGSRNATSPALLKAMRPQAALISCGAGNRYHHPSALALARLASVKGLTIYRSDLNGCLSLEHQGGETRISPFVEVSEALLSSPPPKSRRSPWKNLEKSGRIP